MTLQQLFQVISPFIYFFQFFFSFLLFTLKRKKKSWMYISPGWQANPLKSKSILNTYVGGLTSLFGMFLMHLIRSLQKNKYNEQRIKENVFCDSTHHTLEGRTKWIKLSLASKIVNVHNICKWKFKNIISTSKP